jgi:hypothetical protein
MAKLYNLTKAEMIDRRDVAGIIGMHIIQIQSGNQDRNERTNVDQDSPKTLNRETTLRRSSNDISAYTDFRDGQCAALLENTISLSHYHSSIQRLRGGVENTTVLHDLSQDVQIDTEADSSVQITGIPFEHTTALKADLKFHLRINSPELHETDGSRNAHGSVMPDETNQDDPDRHPNASPSLSTESVVAERLLLKSPTTPEVTVSLSPRTSFLGPSTNIAQYKDLAAFASASSEILQSEQSLSPLKDGQSVSILKRSKFKAVSIDNLNSIPPYVLKTIPAFIPLHVRQFIQEHGRLPDEPVCQEKFGTVVMADVSGYSTLASNLTQRGPIGVELLARTMNAFFDKVSKFNGRQ